MYRLNKDPPLVKLGALDVLEVAGVGEGVTGVSIALPLGGGALLPAALCKCLLAW